MAKQKYAFYPGCSSRKKGSSANYLISVEAICRVLEIELAEIPDWNCCSASIGHIGGGELPRLSLSARNLALSKQAFGDREILITCAACWLAMRSTRERVMVEPNTCDQVNQALAEVDLNLDPQSIPRVRHMVEVLMENVGIEAIKAKVTRPIRGLKVAGYVGCQTNRPFSVHKNSFEDPHYLDEMIAAVGATPLVDFTAKVECCGGPLMFSEPEKAERLVRDILSSAQNAGAEMIVTPCPVCQMNLEAYQSKINQRFSTNFQIPVVFYSTMLAVAFGLSGQEAGLGGALIPASTLEVVAS